MPTLVGLHGHSGAGKSTAADHLARICGGEKIYLGAIVLDELKARSLDRTPENELEVRFDLRKAYGDDYLLAHAEGRIREIIGMGRDVFVDAILSDAEWKRLCTFGSPSTILLSIAAPFETRAERLERRPDRPFDKKALSERDEAEGRRLGTGHLIVGSTTTILNCGTELSFLRSLDGFASTLNSSKDVSVHDPKP